MRKGDREMTKEPTKSFTPLSCIHKECVACMGGQPSLIKDCPGVGCALYSYRFGRRPAGEPPTLRAIKAFCLDCISSDKNEVKNCDEEDCILHFYRLGKNPKRKGQGKGMDRTKQIENLKKWREKSKPTTEKQPKVERKTTKTSLTSH